MVAQHQTALPDPGSRFPQRKSVRQREFFGSSRSLASSPCSLATLSCRKTKGRTLENIANSLEATERGGEYRQTSNQGIYWTDACLSSISLGWDRDSAHARWLVGSGLNSRYWPRNNSFYWDGSPYQSIGKSPNFSAADWQALKIGAKITYMIPNKDPRETRPFKRITLKRLPIALSWHASARPPWHPAEAYEYAAGSDSAFRYTAQQFLPRPVRPASNLRTWADLRQLPGLRPHGRGALGIQTAAQ